VKKEFSKSELLEGKQLFQRNGKKISADENMNI